MARIRTSRWWIGLTAILATAFLGVLAVLIVVGWPRVSEPEPWAWPSATRPAPEPSDTGPQHPEPLVARALTETVLGSVSEGWILAEYDSSAGLFGSPLVERTPGPDEASPAPQPLLVPGEGPPEWEIPGSRYLHLVDPSGTVYLAADLGEGSSLRLVAWLPNPGTAILSQPATGGVTLHPYDLATGELGDAIEDSSGGPATWDAPEVRVSPNGGALVVASAAEAGTITLFGLDDDGLDGSVASVPLTSVEMRGFTLSSDGTVVVVAEMEPGADAPSWTIATYAEPGTSILPAPSPSPTPSPSPSPSVSASAPEWERVSHGLPAGEANCVPVSWPEQRQLLNACTQDDGAVVLYTLALMTSTFVDVAALDLVEEDPAQLTFNRDGTRIFLGRRVVNLFAEKMWELSPSIAYPTGVAWSGEFLISWEASTEPGYGASELSARHASDGDIAWVVPAVEGASGFHAVVAAP